MARKRMLNNLIPKDNSLREIRGASTLKQVCDSIGVDESTWNRWEAGSSFPSVPYIFRIEELTGKSYREIWAKACVKDDGMDPE